MLLRIRTRSFAAQRALSQTLTGRILEIEHEVHVCLLPFECMRWIFRILFPHRVPLVPADLKERCKTVNIEYMCPPLISEPCLCLVFKF